MSFKTVTEKYLSRYAEKEAFSFDDFHKEFSHVVTIPAFDESLENINLVLNSIREKNVLAILIVNSQHNSSNDARKSNDDLIMKIKNSFSSAWKSRNNSGVTFYETKTCGLLLIDRSSKGLELPSKTGVGLARKIAADVALKLISDGKIKTTWIHCTDADVILPSDYFISTSKIQNFSAAIYPYFHRIKHGDELNNKSLLLYELSLRHYVNGLRYAKSNYAFHTIGSTIAVDFEAYAKIRGFPVRESGEDFYILNKLSKIGKIQNISGGKIIIDGRISHRTPFGTGKSVEKISLMGNCQDDFLFYNSNIFDDLRFFVALLNDFENKIFCENINLFSDLTKNNLILKKTLDNIGAFDAIEIAYKSSDNPKIRQKHLNTWFDGFRTLKFVHQMRDLAYPSLPLKQLIKQPLYQSLNLSETLSLEELLNQFKKLDSHLTTDNK